MIPPSLVGRIIPCTAFRFPVGCSDTRRITQNFNGSGRGKCSTAIHFLYHPNSWSGGLRMQDRDGPDDNRWRAPTLNAGCPTIQQRSLLPAKPHVHSRDSTSP
eukprot:11363394-Heterocapsa_arctica.AAC.1